MSKSLKTYAISDLDAELLDSAIEALKEYIQAGNGDLDVRRALYCLQSIVPVPASAESTQPTGAA